MKYMGSKARIANDILPIILANRKDGQYYVEPFAGGMNSMCYVTGNRIASDVNKYLIAMWEQLCTGWVPNKVSKTNYYAIRDNIDDYPAHLVGWVGFNCSYSGKWFGGYAGETTTKVGTVRDYQEEAIRNVLKQVPLLQGVTLNTAHYQELVIPANSIVYCDPPYYGTTKYKDDFDHTAFWDYVRKLHSDGHTVFVSEYVAPGDFTCVWEKSVKSSLSANGKYGGSKSSVEKLFTHV